MEKVVKFDISNYGKLPVGKADFNELYEYMTHDKKNKVGIINFTLMSKVGDIRINQMANRAEILDMLNYFTTIC